MSTIQVNNIQRVDGTESFAVDSDGSVTFAADLNLGDNNKAIFGTTSDGLQIYNTSSGDKIINEAGSGNLKVQGDNLYLQNSAGTENHIIGITGAAVTLHYNASSKLATTATGIDVTGTVTADGLTVDGTTTVGNNQSLEILDGVGDISLRVSNLSSSGNSGVISVDPDNTGASSALQIHIDGVNKRVANFAAGGDISFYEDTGTTAKFFWDASAESLGIGTTPSGFLTNGYVLRLKGGSQTFLAFNNDTHTTQATGGFVVGHDANTAYVLQRENQPLVFATNDIEAMRITSDGKVGIGTSSPDVDLHVYDSDAVAVIKTEGGTGSGAYHQWDVNGGTNIGYMGDGSNLIASGSQTDLGIRASNNLIISSGGTVERMRIESNGEVFMGTTSHYGDSVRLCLRGAGSNNGGVLEIQHTRNAGGGRDFIRFYNETGGEAGGIEHSSSTGVSYQTSSDYRLKENVVDLTGAINRVKQLPVRQFNFIGEDQTVDGFLAHEAQAVVPESASGTKDQIKVWEDYDELPEGVSIGDPKLDDEGNTIPVYQGIDQAKLVPLLTAALKEAIARIEQNETTIADLTARIETLEGN